MTVGAVMMLGVPQIDGRIDMLPDPLIDLGTHSASSDAIERLSGEVARLAADREKLIARLEILERQMGAKNVASAILSPQDVPAITGSIGRVSGATPAATGSMEPTETATIQDGPVRRIAFGIDLGSAASVDRLKDRWTAMQELYGQALAKLEPRVVFGRTRDGAVELRLLAGPFPNAELAVKACSEIQRQPGSCEPRPFDGEPLSKS
ncbi:SPOR domain-containing protein [Agaricicola taiwanensis]|nr:SPOR domain-containing protein [Agaricicola taiwanensis]